MGGIVIASDESVNGVCIPFGHILHYEVVAEGSSWSLKWSLTALLGSGAVTVANGKLSGFDTNQSAAQVGKKMLLQYAQGDAGGK